MQKRIPGVADAFVKYNYRRITGRGLAFVKMRMMENCILSLNTSNSELCRSSHRSMKFLSSLYDCASLVTKKVFIIYTTSPDTLGKCCLRISSKVVNSI